MINVKTLINLLIKLILKLFNEKPFDKNKLEFILRSGLTNPAKTKTCNISEDLLQFGPYTIFMIS